MSLISARNLDKFYRGMKSSSTFDIDFIGFSEGDTFRIVSGTEVITGEVPESLEVAVAVKKLNAQYTVSATHSGITYYTIVNVGQYYGSYGITINASVLDNISVRTPLLKTSYIVGEYLDLNGLGISATYEDESVLDVTEDCTYSIAKTHRMTLEDTSLVVYYTESGVTKSVSIQLTVSNVDVVALANRVAQLELNLALLANNALQVIQAEEEQSVEGD